MSVFTPDIMLADLTQVSPAFLRLHDIRGIVLDVDNTLTNHGSQSIRPEISQWIRDMDALGIRLMIVSNNSYKRVKPFADSIGVDFIARGCKPLPIGLNQAQKRFGLPREQIAMVGDQIYTDVLGGNLKGFYTVLVKPFVLEDGPFFRLKRNMETIHISAYQKKRGAYNDQR
jgi:HAD superfamily phosphatase (TIGR01668 family)